MTLTALCIFLLVDDPVLCLHEIRCHQDHQHQGHEGVNAEGAKETVGHGQGHAYHVEVEIAEGSVFEAQSFKNRNEKGGGKGDEEAVGEGPQGRAPASAGGISEDAGRSAAEEVGHQPGTMRTPPAKPRMSMPSTPPMKEDTKPSTTAVGA